MNKSALLFAMFVSPMFLACGAADSDEQPAVSAAELSQGALFGRHHIKTDGQIGLFQDGFGLASNYAPVDVIGTLCTVETYPQPAGGKCEVTSCAQTFDPSDIPALVSAGTIRGYGFNEPVQMSPNPDNSYPFFFGSGPLWDGGEMVTVTWSGAHGGALPGVALMRAPSTGVTLTSSIWPSVDPSEDLSVKWTTPSAAWGNSRVWVYLTSWDGTYVEVTPDFFFFLPVAQVACNFKVGNKAGVIPSELLGTIPPGPMGEVSATIQVENNSTLFGISTGLVVGVNGNSYDPVIFE